MKPGHPSGAFDPIALALRLRDAPLERTIEVLRSLHADLEWRARANHPDAPPTGRQGYERARELYYERTTRDRGGSVADAVIAQVLPPPPPVLREGSVLQQELRLQVIPRGVAAGRFALANELGHPVSVDFRSGRLREVGSREPLPGDTQIRLEPSALRLGVDEECAMRIEVDLADCPAGPGAKLEVAVDLMGGEGLLLKLWVVITLRGEA
jgi:hypothetical protein